MQNSKSKKATLKQIENLRKKSKFSSEEVKTLIKIHSTSGRDKMDAIAFKGAIHSLVGLTEEAILDKMFRVFDTNGDNYIQLEEWIMGLSIILRGDLETLKAYCFKIYDLDNDGFITKDNIVFLLKDSFVPMEDNDDLEQQVKKVAELAIKKMDLDKDGRLSLEDFSKSVDKDHLLLEAFGPCLPNRKVTLETEAGIKESLTEKR